MLTLLAIASMSFLTYQLWALVIDLDDEEDAAFDGGDE